MVSLGSFCLTNGSPWCYYSNSIQFRARQQICIRVPVSDCTFHQHQPEKLTVWGPEVPGNSAIISSLWLVGGKLFNPVMTVVVWQGAVLDNYCRLLQRFKQEWEDCLQNKAIYWCLGNGLKVLLKDFVLCHFSRLFCCFCTIYAAIWGYYPVKVTPPPLISYKKEVSLQKQITSSTLTSRSCFSPLRENGTRGSFIAVYLSKTNKKRR